MKKAHNFKWLKIFWPRPFDVEAVRSILIRIATMGRSGHIAFEVRASKESVRYLMGASEGDLLKLHDLIASVLPNTRFSGSDEHVQRADVSVARKLKLSHAGLSLDTGNTEAVIHALLAALAEAGHRDEEMVLQMILGNSCTPSFLPDKPANPSASWLDALRGTVGQAGGEAKRLMREKTECHGFGALARIGTSIQDIRKAQGHIRAVCGALRTMETAGARLSLAPCRPEDLNSVARPWFFPTRLSTKELPAFLGWPVGKLEYPGVAGLHPRVILPPRGYRGNDRAFGVTSIGDLKLGISAQDSLRHTVFVGPTGVGKSTAMRNLILADVASGRSVVVVDPKSDLIHSILERVPEERTEDVVVISPSASSPVGLNPLSTGGKSPTLTADTILATLQDLFADSWGVRTQDILTAALTTLASIKGSNLIWLPALLTDDSFRRRLLKHISDPVGLDAFWAGYESMSPAERNQVIAPVMNKLRQFLLRPELRAVLGQSEPKFQMSDIFYKRRIVLVELNKGIIGRDSAKLLGSLLIGQLWTLALGRAAIPPEKRRIVSVYIDEVADYLRLPGDLSDALSTARGMGVGLTLAHQFRNQLSANLRAAIDANVQNKVAFTLGAADARDMAAMAAGLEPEDFMLLPEYNVYATLLQGGKSTGWLSGKTLPASEALRPADELKAKSMAAYGRDKAEVVKEYLNAIGYLDRGDGKDDDTPDEPFSRRKRGET